ncbi:MAG TPA: sulfite exporter TauE/SafE family protein [Tepidisphaeraceae bacterium]|jgi:hypothetical protein|nr:sulfite exporter TauE/SafE family protein [Tepidisphaeraceae bacterium]
MIWWSIVFLAVFLIGVTKSGFGSGVGLMVVPMTAIAMGHIPGRGSESALGLLLPLLIAGDLIAVWQYSHLFFAKYPRAAQPIGAGASFSPDDPEIEPQHVQARAVIRRLMPGTIVGVVLGGLLLAWLRFHANLVGALIRIEIGWESILLVSIHWWRIYRGVQQRLLPEPWRSGITGGFAAVSSTLAHAAGPIIAMYLLPLRLDRQLYVATSAVYFFLLNSAKLPAYYASGLFAHAAVSFTIRLLPLVIGGAIFGRWLNKRLSDLLFTKIVYIVTFALGCYILTDGILRLFGRHIA